MNQDTVEKIASLIGGMAVGTIFSCKFVKRTTGEERLMVCRLGVSKGVTGAGAKFDALEKALIRVYDMQKDGWRSIPLDAIIEITIRGNKYTFDHTTGEAKKVS